jgi:hypothetical protein
VSAVKSQKVATKTDMEGAEIIAGTCESSEGDAKEYNETLAREDFNRVFLI